MKRGTGLIGLMKYSILLYICLGIGTMARNIDVARVTRYLRFDHPIVYVTSAHRMVAHLTRLESFGGGSQDRQYYSGGSSNRSVSHSSYSISLQG